MLENDFVNSSVSKIFIRKPRILLVEDSPFTQRVHMKFLELLECSPDLAENGIQALRMYSNQYDLILMDIGLPDLSGLEVSYLIRHRTKNGSKRLPIVAFTGFGDLVKEQCEQASIDDLLIKPAPPEELEMMLKKWLPELLSKRN